MTQAIGPMTGRACRNVGVGNSILKDLFSLGYEFPRSAPERSGIESPKVRGKRRYHRGTEDMRHVQHDVIRAPALNKGLQLIFEILGLLACEPRDGKKPAIALPRWPVAVLAVPYLGGETVLGFSRWVGRVGTPRRDDNNRQDCHLQCQLEADDLRGAASTSFACCPGSSVAMRYIDRSLTTSKYFGGTTLAGTKLRYDVMSFMILGPKGAGATPDN